VKRMLVEFLVILAISWLIEFWYSSFRGIFEGTTLSLLEISLSFDNAVMNAVVLSGLSAIWRRRFLTWGMLIAVFGMRFLFPVLIVSVTAKLPPLKVVNIAVKDPELYHHYLSLAHHLILAFGGAFLLMVFINWLFDAGREIHWIEFFEEKAVQIAKLGEIKLIVALSIALLVGFKTNSLEILIAMLLGILSFEIVRLIKDLVRYFRGEMAGIGAFLYLEILDASCSLDGTVGAFAISKDLVIITIGLSVGAFILRSLTVHFVESGKLQQLPYLEHGAHWGIGGLGIMMILQIFYHIPEVIVSFVALLFVISSLVSSLRKRGLLPT